MRVTPKLKIEKAKALVLLSKAKNNLQARPNQQLIVTKLQEEFDTLFSHMSEYYSVKKKLLSYNKEKLSQRYEHSVAKLEYQQIKLRVQQQRILWNQLVKQYA